MRFDNFIVANGYSRLEYDPYVYFRPFNDDSLELLKLYINDMLIVAKRKSDILQLKSQTFFN